MTRIKAFVTDMATRNATPFMHRLLYRDYTPECIVSCFSTSVLYSNRTPANTAMVMRALQGGARDLVTNESARFVTTTTERLARAQALFVYQVIRLFDGDITLRAQAEKDIPLLNVWLVELCKMRDNLSTVARLEHGVAKPQPPEWEVSLDSRVPSSGYRLIESCSAGYSPSLSAGRSSWPTRCFRCTSC